MNMRLYSSDRMEMYVWHRYDAIFYKREQVRLQFFGNEREAVFCVPGDVKIYFGIDSNRHI